MRHRSFRIPKSISHSSGIFLAIQCGKKIIKYIFVICATLVAAFICVYLNPQNSVWVIDVLFFLLIGLLCQLPVFMLDGYFKGRAGSKHIDYLEDLKKKCQHKMDVFERKSDETMSGEEARRFKVAKREINNFFDPLIVNYRVVCPHPKIGYKQLKKASGFFQQQVKRIENPLYKEIANLLEVVLADLTLDAITNRQPLVFSHQWLDEMKKIDLSSLKSQIHFDVWSEYFEQKTKLLDSQDDINYQIVARS